jgi:hypothetical protein
LCGFEDVEDLQRAHRQWIEEALASELGLRDARWSEAIAVGSLAFVETVKNDLGMKATHREVIEADGTYALRERAASYARNFIGETEGSKLGKYSCVG